MRHIRYRLTVRIRAPFLFPGAQAGRFGLDLVAMRDKEGKKLILPQEQIRGVVRAQIELMLADISHDDPRLSEFRSLFGVGSADVTEIRSDSFEPDGRAKIFFSDLTAMIEVTSNSRIKQPYTRVEIDDTSGAAKSGHLLRVEQVFAPGAEVDFVGTVDLFSESTKVAEQLLCNALSSLDQIGRFETIGFGEVLLARADQEPVVSIDHDCPAGEIIDWEFVIDRPYLVNSVREADNVFRGDADIPGGALKGLLIRNMELRGVDIGKLSDDLAKLSISHSHYLRNQRTIPLSVRVQNGKAVDCLGETECSKVTFQVDFKPKHEAIIANLFQEVEHIPDLAFEERVHTAINSASGAAYDEKLYSTLAVRPASSYLARVDFSRVSDAARSEIVAALRRPLLGLGKTSAILQTSRLSLGDAPIVKPIRENLYAVVIESSALMVEPVEGKNLEECLRSFWREMLPSSRLVDFYAEVLPLGGYLGRRYSAPSGHYRPFWLTQPGSVFLLEISDADTIKFQHLIRHGICIPIIDGRITTWHNCPFVSENGYGRISANWTGVPAPCQ